MLYSDCGLGVERGLLTLHIIPATCYRVRIISSPFTSHSLLHPTHVLVVFCVSPVPCAAYFREVSPPVAHLLTLYSQSKHSDLQQRCLEFLQLAREGPVAMAAVLPVDASCEDVEVGIHRDASHASHVSRITHTTNHEKPFCCGSFFFFFPSADGVKIKL